MRKQRAKHGLYQLHTVKTTKVPIPEINTLWYKNSKIGILTQISSKFLSMNIELRIELGFDD